MSRFDYFVVFAEMRTGSNFLEANINAFEGLVCHGEAFNPSFIGFPNRADILGVTRAEREADPGVLIQRIRDRSEGLGGFRFFNDHDPRVLDICLPDPRCAKIVLTRNPLESYVSRLIARATGQWKLTNVTHAKTLQVAFDATEFEAHLAALQAFQVRLLNALQRSGQTAFYLDYEDIQDVEVMNGLAAFLGCKARIDGLDRKLKKQNPEPMDEKVSNFGEMEAALARLDRFNLSRTPNFEPRRGAAVPSFVAAPKSPLLYMPVRGGPDEAVQGWLSALDGGGAPLEQFTQKTLRQWKLDRPGHRGFTVLRHPLARAHAVFCERILPVGPGTFPQLRASLIGAHRVPIPPEGPGPGYDGAAHHAAFLAFLKFLKANLGGQTSLRIDQCWASQSVVLHGIGSLALPDLVLREDALGEGLAMLGAQIGRSDVPPPPASTDPHAARLAKILDDALEAAAREAYMRDYIAFGFGPWVPPRA